ncbi:RNA methylase-like protein [Elsinoe fawcettii]|nr:RNA methylase-like protein [Elsinoe fawcettii]
MDDDVLAGVAGDLYLVRFVQLHETFRLPELRALAEYYGIVLDVVDYRADSPFAIIRLPSTTAATNLISRSVLTLSISSLWGSAPSYDLLHTDLKSTTSHLWSALHTVPFRFNIDSFRGKRPQSTRSALINSFGYMDLQGPILPSDESVLTFVISEEYSSVSSVEKIKDPSRVFLSTHLASSSRHLVTKLDLKHRQYISTTSMDAELSLITANLALVGEGKVAYDPFCGTGSFLVAAAQMGAMVAGSDLDGRVVRGKIKEAKNAVVKRTKIEDREKWGTRRERKEREGMEQGRGEEGEEKPKEGGKRMDKGKGERSIRGNLMQYGLEQKWLDGFAGDLTNSPIRGAEISHAGEEGQRGGRWIDAIICDPPYGVREGLKVLGSHKPELQEEVKMKDGRVAHLAPGYIPPKRPYSFDAMLADILTFAANTLVNDGRLCMWVPVENAEDEGNAGAKDLGIPTHPCLKLWSVSTQEFTRWSRRLIVYIRKHDSDVNETDLKQYNAMRRDKLEKGTADELNEFRRRFFEGFKAQNGSATQSSNGSSTSLPVRIKDGQEQNT